MAKYQVLVNQRGRSFPQRHPPQEPDAAPEPAVWGKEAPGVGSAGSGDALTAPALG